MSANTASIAIQIKQLNNNITNVILQNERQKRSYSSKVL